MAGVEAVKTERVCKNCSHFRVSGERCTCALDDCIVAGNGSCDEFVAYTHVQGGNN